MARIKWNRYPKWENLGCKSGIGVKKQKLTGIARINEEITRRGNIGLLRFGRGCRPEGENLTLRHKELSENTKKINSKGVWLQKLMESKNGTDGTLGTGYL